MKKTYSKPEIMFEDFTMSESIATGCEKIANQALFECKYMYSRKYEIFAAEHGCRDSLDVERDPVTGDYIFPQDNGLCYHVPAESNNLFTS